MIRLARKAGMTVLTEYRLGQSLIHSIQSTDVPMLPGVPRKGSTRGALHANDFR